MELFAGNQIDDARTHFCAGNQGYECVPITIRINIKINYENFAQEIKVTNVFRSSNRAFFEAAKALGHPVQLITDKNGIILFVIGKKF